LINAQEPDQIRRTFAAIGILPSIAFPLSRTYAKNPPVNNLVIFG
jgi:hypothetical protein